MYFRLMGKLNARRQNLVEDTEKGFTLIELLVVVIIIGILAAIAIPVYLGVQNNAKNSSTQSDVTNLKTAVVSIQTNAGGYPTAAATFSSTSSIPASSTSPSPDWSAAGATLNSNTTTLTYTPITSGSPATVTGFCVKGVSAGGGTFYANASTGVTTTQVAGC